MLLRQLHFPGCQAAGHPEGCAPSAGHDGGGGDFHHGGFHFGLHLQRCVFPQRQQQRRPRRCRAPCRGHWGFRPPPRAGACGLARTYGGSALNLRAKPRSWWPRRLPPPSSSCTPRGPSLGAFRLGRVLAQLFSVQQALRAQPCQCQESPSQNWCLLLTESRASRLEELCGSGWSWEIRLVI